MLDTVNRNKTQAKRWEKIFAKDTSDKGLLSKLCKELKLNDKKTNKSILKWSKGDFNRHFTKEDTQMTKKHVKRYSMLYVFREMQIKITIRYHCNPMKMVKIWNTNETKCC